MDPYLFKASKALSKEACLMIIGYFDKDEAKLKKLGPQNQQCILKNEFYYEYMPMIVDTSPLLNPLLENLKLYSKAHPFLLKVPPWGITKTCNVQKYNPGKYYSDEHCEHMNNLQCSLRVLAWMFYLNDVDDGGGGTRFPQQKETLDAKEGDLYIWPAGWTHSHLGVPALKENKYIVTGWCSYGVMLDMPVKTQTN